METPVAPAASPTSPAPLEPESESVDIANAPKELGRGGGVWVRRRHRRGAVVPICKDWAAPSNGSDASQRGGHDALIWDETLEP